MGDRHTTIIQIEDDLYKPENHACPTKYSSNATCSSNNIINTKKPVTMDLDLYKATIEGKLDHFKKLTDHPHSLFDQRTPLGNSYLHVAATLGHEDQVKFIISRYPRLIAATNMKGDTPLHAAVQSRKTAVIRALMQFVTTDSPQRAASVAEGGVAMGTFNVDCRRPDILLWLMNRKGNTALHEAMTTTTMADGDEERRLVTEYLNILGVQVLFSPNNEGKSPFYLAVEYGKKDLVELMLQNCRDRGYTSEDMIKGKSPVNAAIRGRNKDNCSLSEKKRKKRWLPQTLRPTNDPTKHVESNRIEAKDAEKGMLETILDIMPTFIQLRDGDGETPLHCAASTGDYEGIQYLLEKSSECVLERDDNGFLPVHTASGKGHVDILKKLLEKYPKEGWRELLTNKGENILHVAAKNRKTEVVDYILKTPEHKELLNERDDFGNTPLHLAAIHWSAEVLCSLARDKRIRLELVNGDGMTALDAADEGKVMTASFRKRLTWMGLKSMGVPNKKCSKAPKKMEEYKDTINTLLLVAALIATVTYAAGFTMPGGYSDSDPNQGIAIMLHKLKFKIFIFCDTIAMFSSMIVVLCLIWAQLGDPNFILTFLRWALLFLGLALSMMSASFIAGVYLVVKKLNWLADVVLIMGIVLLDILMALFFPLFIPDTPVYPVIRHISYYVFRLMIFLRLLGET